MPFSAAIPMDESSKTNEAVEPQTQNEVSQDNEQTKVAPEVSTEASDVGKEEVSPYKKQLDEVNARLKEKEEQLAKKDEAIKVKNRAIKALKGENAEEAEGEESLEDKILAKLEAKQASKDFVSAVASLTVDEAEKALVQKLYASDSFVKTGDVQRDLRNALALANADQLFELRQSQLRGEMHENSMAALSASTVGSVPSQTTFKSAAERQAERWVEIINPKAKGQVGKYFQQK